MINFENFTFAQLMEMQEAQNTHELEMKELEVEKAEIEASNESYEVELEMQGMTLRMDYKHLTRFMKFMQSMGDE